MIPMESKNATYSDLNKKWKTYTYKSDLIIKANEKVNNSSHGNIRDTNW